MPAGGLAVPASAAILASYHDSTIADEHRAAGIRFTPTMNAVVSTNSTSSIDSRMELLFAILNEPMAKVTPQKSHPANGKGGEI